MRTPNGIEVIPNFKICVRGERRDGGEVAQQHYLTQLMNDRDHDDDENL